VSLETATASARSGAGLPGACRRSTRISVLLAVAVLLGWLSGLAEGPDAAWAAPGSRSSLDRPVQPGPIYLLGSFSVGGAVDYDAFRTGYGLTILFRPNAAADFLRLLYDWNTSILLQASYRTVNDGRRLLAADFIVRHYLCDMRGHGPGAAPFVGLGFGGAEITYPSGGSTACGKWFTYTAEAGYEYSPGEKLVFALKGQWRRYSHDGLDYSGWSAHFGVGIPLPW